MKIGTKEARELFQRHNWEWNEKWLGLEVKPIKRKRSVDQNARYWVIVSALAEFSGDTKQGVHEDALKEYHGSEVFTGANGRTKERARGRSHNLTTEDFSGLMMIVEKWAGDMGVPLELAA